MPRRPTLSRRWLTALTWPAGIALTSWDYMWRTTPMHRRETLESATEDADAPSAFPRGVDATEVVGQESGRGPLFHRRYRTRIRDAKLSPEALMAIVESDPNRAAPTTFARFQKVLGEEGAMAVGDEFVVRMPGPWDGPVRVIAAHPTGFRLATLKGHLEAGEIEFRASTGDRRELVFEIESRARSSDWLANVLYHRLRMAKEVQLHMWISFLEGVVSLSGGRMSGGIDIATRRIEGHPDDG